MSEELFPIPKTADEWEEANRLRDDGRIGFNAAGRLVWKNRSCLAIEYPEPAPAAEPVPVCTRRRALDIRRYRTSDRVRGAYMY